MNVLIISDTENTDRFDLARFDQVFTFQYQTDYGWAGALPFDTCLISKWVTNLPRFRELYSALKESAHTFGGSIAIESAFVTVEPTGASS